MLLLLKHLLTGTTYQKYASAWIISGTKSTHLCLQVCQCSLVVPGICPSLPGKWCSISLLCKEHCAPLGCVFWSRYGKTCWRLLECILDSTILQAPEFQSSKPTKYFERFLPACGCMETGPSLQLHMELMPLLLVQIFQEITNVVASYCFWKWMTLAFLGSRTGLMDHSIRDIVRWNGCTGNWYIEKTALRGRFASIFAALAWSLAACPSQLHHFGFQTLHLRTKDQDIDAAKPVTAVYFCIIANFLAWFKGQEEICISIPHPKFWKI